MSGFVAFALLLCVSSVTALLFQSDPPVATSNGRPINQSCLALAEAGSCDFYTCFESRLPCGREWYILRLGHYYCNKLQRERANFSPEGQQFLDDSKVCLTRSLKDLYEREFIDCHDLEHQAVSAITPCYTENGFCAVLETDANNFFNVYEFRDLFSRRAAKIWRAIVALATSCGGEALRQFSANTGQSVSSAFNNFFGSLSDRLGK